MPVWGGVLEMKLISPKDSIVSLLHPPRPPRRGAAAESFAQSYDVVMVR